MSYLSAFRQKLLVVGYSAVRIFLSLKTQNSKLKTQNSKLKTQNSKLKTQNSKLKTDYRPATLTKLSARIQ